MQPTCQPLRKVEKSWLAATGRLLRSDLQPIQHVAGSFEVVWA